VATFEDLYTERLNLTLNNSDSNALYTTARRKSATNDAVQEFAALTKCYVRRSTVTVVHDQREYDVLGSTDFSELSEKGLVEYHRTDTSGRFVQLAGDDFPRNDELWRNRYEPGWRSSTTPVQAPTGYYLRPDGGRLKIGLAEPPRVTSGEAASLVIPYVARPPQMVDSTAVPFTDTSGITRTDLTDYHLAFPHYAAYRLLPLIGDAQGANEQLQVFLGYVTRYIQNQRPKGGQHITVARSYFRGAQMRGGYADASVNRDPRWRWR
jgi:hypothetical protein